MTGLLSPPPLSDRVPGRVKSVSQGSGVGYDSDSVEMHPMDECLEAQYYHVQCRLGEGGGGGGGGGGGYDRAGASRSWGLRKQAIQNWQRRPYRNSTEGEEGDVSDDVGSCSRTTESEAELWEQEHRVPTDCQQPCRSAYRLGTHPSTHTGAVCVCVFICICILCVRGPITSLLLISRTYIQIWSCSIHSTVRKQVMIQDLCKGSPQRSVVFPGRDHDRSIHP